jgi:hypothetical protein
LGHNKLGDEGIIGLIPCGLERNRSLLNLGLQENGLTCSGIISLSESLATGTLLKRVDLRKNNIALAGLMALAAALKHCPTITQLDLDPTDPSTSSSSCDQQNAAEYQRLIEEIATCCTSHETEANDGDTLSSLPSDLNTKRSANNKEADSDETISRKISLTCLVPPSEKQLLLPLNNKEDDQQPRRKLRSPLPSPSPSPSPSPLPSPSGGRFKVLTIFDSLISYANLIEIWNLPAGNQSGSAESIAFTFPSFPFHRHSSGFGRFHP